MRFLVPRRADEGSRDTLWDHCHKHWSQGCPDIPITVGSSPDGPFNRAAAINDAARGSWDIGVVLDADVLADPAQVYTALERAMDTGRVTLPYDVFLGLTASMTKRVLAGREGDWTRGVRFRSRTHESSIVVIPRTAWDAVGGFDERFVGWGQEDVAFIQSVRVLVGEIDRIGGPVYHLEHGDRAARGKGTPLYEANQVLGARYRETKEPEAMRELLAERDMSERQRTFAGIWARNAWNGTETPAGPGSTMLATRTLQEELSRIIGEMGITSVLDAGCADSLWMPELPGYIGVDIIPAAIERAKERHPDRTYFVADICADELPRCEAVIVRDALQHLSLRDGLTALQNFRRTGVKWLLASSHEGEENSDVLSGGYYPCNLEAAPFWLGPPRWAIPDGIWDAGVRYPNKVFGLWEL